MHYEFFDVHSHLHFPQFDADRDEIIARMRTEHIGTINVGTNLATSREAVALAHAHDHLFATVGIHPHDTGGFTDAHTALRELAGDARVVAVGECGLDYFRLEGTQQDITTAKDAQRILFQEHIQLAHEHNLPLMIHARPSAGTMDAYEEILEILESIKHQTPSTGARGDVHFFAGSRDIAGRFLDAGFTLSFDGPITFTPEYDDVIRYVPDDKIMAETDAPFAAPVPFRGKRCDPTMVRFVAERIADIRGEERENMLKKLVQNARTTFRLPAQATG